MRQQQARHVSVTHLYHRSCCVNNGTRWPPVCSQGVWLSRLLSKRLVFGCLYIVCTSSCPRPEVTPGHTSLEVVHLHHVAPVVGVEGVTQWGRRSNGYLRVDSTFWTLAPLVSRLGAVTEAVMLRTVHINSVREKMYSLSYIRDRLSWSVVHTMSTSTGPLVLLPL